MSNLYENFSISPINSLDSMDLEAYEPNNISEIKGFDINNWVN